MSDNLELEQTLLPSIVTGIFSYVTECVLAIGCIRAAHTLHTLLFLNVLKAPVYFFDVTPSGRILQRFSKDMDVLDTQLPIMMSDFLSCLTEVCITVLCFFLYDFAKEVVS